MPAPGDQALLLLLPARLASSRLLAAWRDGPQYGPGRERRLESLSRLPGRTAHRAAHELRATRRHLVRRHVGQTERGLAAAADLRADSSAAARGADRTEPSSGAITWRGCTDVRAGSTRCEHRRLQYQEHRRLAARDVAHDERFVGLQSHRPPLQIDARADSLSRAGRWRGR